MIKNHKRTLNELGNTYGKLTVLEHCGTDHRGHATWKCSCSCGGTIVVRGSYLRYGKVRSCGCLLQEMAEARRIHRTPEEQRLYDREKQRKYRERQKLGLAKPRLKLTKEARAERQALADERKALREPTGTPVVSSGLTVNGMSLADWIRTRA